MERSIDYMLYDPKLTDEAARLAAVHRYDLLDTPPEPEFEQLTVLLKSIFAAPIVLISLIDDRRQWCKSSIGLDIKELPRDQTFCQYTIRSLDVMVIEDATQDPRFKDHPFVTQEGGIRSYLGAPLTSPDGYNIGTICIIDTKPRIFTQNDIAVLKQFSDVVISQFELRQIASRDMLTGVWTRRAFLEAAKKELARYHRHGHTISLALFDLDHFKSINDAHGHGVGDAVLRETVRSCHEAMRGEEVLGRIGGEEFAMLLVNVSGDAALQAADRFRSNIEGASIKQEPELRFTASFGVADCSTLINSVEEWLALADQALYRAKARGRNRCESPDFQE
ncbi:sensor domain-containing diguanylate cyclase [Mesorhizobium sp. SB112]|uniref:sensor domain-containing diguanylate cyclase n=1 Tax=Mesorhizobium sp. SB112 TaxID=3151853 RepID=UPI00326637D1